jgi:hypothetical protein
MDVSKERPQVTAGLDLGDKYSHPCLIDSQSGEVIEEGRLRTSPEAFRRRFSSEQPMRIPEALRPALGPILEQIGSLTQRIRDYDRKLEEISKERYPESELLRQVEGT